MLALTSLSPSHKNADVQKACIQSWIDNGFTPVSLNHPDELDMLGDIYDNVRLVPTYSTMEATFGRPYVRVSALIDYAKGQEDEQILLINSDIKIIDNGGLTDKLKALTEKAVVFIHRWDYENDLDKAMRYDLGIDAMFLNKRHLGLFPQSNLCLGQCFWDYVFPYQAQKAGAPLKRVVEKYIYHKAHHAQYSKENWQHTAQIARTECQLWGYFKAEGISAMLYNQIMRQAQKNANL